MQEAGPKKPASFFQAVVIQAGFKYRLSEKYSLSLDSKYLYLQPDALYGGSNATPKSLGLGLDIKF